MLACRARPRCLAARSFFSTSSAPPPTTSTSTSTTSTSTSGPADKPQDSIFTAPESPWDHVFSDIESDAPLPAPSQRIRTRLGDANSANGNALSSRPNGPGARPQRPSLVQRSSGIRRQRASITAREMSVFDEMFDLIFSAVSSAKDGKSGSGSGSGSARATGSPGSGSGSGSASGAPSSFSSQMPGIGRAGAPLNDLFRTLRRHTSRVRWTSAIDEELDRKKETMELFNTDHDLLRWVTQELFGASQRWDEEAERAIAASSAGGTKEGEGNGRSATAAASTDASATSSSPPPLGSSKEGPSNHSIYPHLIAHAMRIFRTTYSNPSLSLAIFNHAARVSIPSYVFGCTAPAYNELIEAKWDGWGDLEGVCNALEEMRANGIKIDGRTRIVAEKVRREVGEARPVEFGEPTLEAEGEVGRPNDINLLARRVWGELGEVEVMRLLHRIEQLALRDRSRKSTRSSPHEESWKSEALQPEDDGWTFDGWDKKRTRDTKKQRRKAKPSSEDQTNPRGLDDWTMLGKPEEEMVFR